jgi:hypothetical protein
VLSEAGRWMAWGGISASGCAWWRGLNNSVVAEGQEPGSLTAAAVQVPRQGAGWHEVGLSASAVVSGGIVQQCGC